MISAAIKQQIEKLFSEKKYQEVIDISNEFINEKERPPGLSSMLGTCEFLKKNRSEEDIKSGLFYFEEAYLKGGNSIQGLNGIINYINGSLDAATKNYSFLKYIEKAETYYYKCEKYFSENPNFLIAAKELFKFQLNQVQAKKIIDKLIINKNVPIKEKTGAIFDKNYHYDWSQLEYTNQVKVNSLNFSKYQVKNLNKINLKNDNKINIGFVSGDFTDQHSIFYFLKDTFSNLDKNIFKIFLFSFNRGENSKWLGQKQIKSLADEFIDLDKYNNQESINIIQDKNVYILIDLMGFTLIDRLSIFNSRVSPVQMSWLASCNTNGFANIDYLIADENVIPKEEEHFYPEKIIKVSDIWNAHCGFEFERKQNKPPSENNEYFTFGSLNSFHKISDETIESWSEILNKCKNSKLLLKSSTFNCNREKIIDKFDKFGVADKIVLDDARKYPYKDGHLNVYNKIDIALDTFPYNGVTTTFEALWMGVPVIVLKGFNFNSKCGYSIIKSSNFDDLIAYNTQEYVEKSVFYYENRNELSNLRNNVFKNILSTPLFQTKKFAKDFSQIMLRVINKSNYK